jgi:hypothetical protein
MYIYIYRNRISKDIINQSRSSDLIIAGKWNRLSDFIVNRAILGRSRSSDRRVNRATFYHSALQTHVKTKMLISFL